jgi:predicted Rossmann fold nucleotide-binding protein DprA/Smf involved in DNA uptake
LLADGGRPLLDPRDLLEAMGLAGAAGVPRNDGAAAESVPADAETAAILRELDDEPSSVDELVAATRLDETVILEKLTSLELDGLAERLPGGTYVRCRVASVARERS